MSDSVDAFFAEKRAKFKDRLMTVFGRRVDEMERKDLLAVIQMLSEDVEHQRSSHSSTLDMMAAINGARRNHG